MRLILVRNVFLGATLWSNAVVASEIFIHDVNVIDGQINELEEHLDLIISSGVIKSIGKNLTPAKGINVVEGAGLYAMPGLIDCHAHVGSVPGAEYRHDSDDTIDTLRKQQLKAFLEAGVTTVMDPAIPWPVYQSLKQYTESTHLGPDIVALNPFLTPNGGYMASPASRKRLFKELWAPTKTDDDIIKYIQFAQQERSLGIKVALEEGFGPLPHFRIYNEHERALIKTEAQKRQVKLFIHSMNETQHFNALAMNPYALVHVGYYEGQPSFKFIEELKKQNPYVISTLAIYDLLQLIWDDAPLKDPYLRTFIPSPELQTLADEHARSYLMRELVSESKPPWVPYFLAAPFAKWFVNEGKAKTFEKSMQRAIKLMYDRGIRLVMGSDSGNWPVLTSYFHAYGTIRELELLAEAGIPLAEIVRMSTSRAAEMIAQSSTKGTIAIGKNADIIILRENPLTTAKAYRSVKLVIKDGIVYDNSKPK